jgi:hypothetical protein
MPGRDARDDFTEPVKRILAARAGNRCSKPDCRALTSGPQVDDGKALNVGVAAHITAAAPGGPRFDPNLSLEQRGAASNGIWLCQTCGKLVDNDPARYTRTMLIDWKRQAENEAQEEIGKTRRLADFIGSNATTDVQAAVRGVIVEMLEGIRLALSGSATALPIANGVPFPSAKYFRDKSWTRYSELLAQTLNIEVLDRIATAYDSARRVFDFAGNPYPDTKVKFQIPSMLVGVARELLEAAFLLSEHIADPGERQRFEENLPKLRADINLQRKMTELMER